MFDNLRKRFAYARIISEAKALSRQKRVFNIEDAKTIGIVFRFTTNEDFDLLKKYVLYLREMKKKVKAIGYYSTKSEPRVQYSKVDYDLFGKSSFNWFGKPTDHILKNFIEEEFDILIDLNPEDDLVITYIAATSRAHFKIGRYAENNVIHDMQIES
ncbi:MAG TPA: hypothetical protein VI731_00070, partial [Bacteroidia bacterium]|nr:hypothetical protein [Bacteroidia bacterium]